MGPRSTNVPQMSWTRRPAVLAVAVVAALALVVINAGERGFFFWLGLGLFFGNMAALARWFNARREVAEWFPPTAEEEWRAAGFREVTKAEVTLADVLDHPDVRREFDRLPPGSVDVPALASWVHVCVWGMGVKVELAEEASAYVDLDVDEYRDPLLQALSSHFTVKSVSRPERGIYVGEFHEDIRATAIAPVVTRALVAGHLATVRTG